MWKHKLSNDVSGKMTGFKQLPVISHHNVLQKTSISLQPILGRSWKQSGARTSVFAQALYYRVVITSVMSKLQNDEVSDMPKRTRLKLRTTFNGVISYKKPS